LGMSSPRSTKNGAHCPVMRIIYLPSHRKNRVHVVAPERNERFASRYTYMALVRGRHHRSTAAGERQEAGCGSNRRRAFGVGNIRVGDWGAERQRQNSTVYTVTGLDRESTERSRYPFCAARCSCGSRKYFAP